MSPKRWMCGFFKYSFVDATVVAVGGVNYVVGSHQVFVLVACINLCLEQGFVSSVTRCPRQAVALAGPHTGGGMGLLSYVVPETEHPPTFPGYIESTSFKLAGSFVGIQLQNMVRSILKGSHLDSPFQEL